LGEHLTQVLGSSDVLLGGTLCDNFLKYSFYLLNHRFKFVVE